MVLTKADKLSKGRSLEALKEVERACGADYPGASVQLFSAHTRLGLPALQTVLNTWFGFGKEKKEAPARLSGGGDETGA
jgi:GTP-binding protein